MIHTLNPEPVTREAMFMGINGDLFKGQVVYPRWMYRGNDDPVLCRSAEEEEKLRADGYDSITAGAMANHYLPNWAWDLEDMSARQLRVFARDEYGVDLPEEAGQEKLYRCVLTLARHAPQNDNRLVLMAHSMKMNYDETIEEIKRMQGENVRDVEVETVEYEVWA